MSWTQERARKAVLTRHRGSDNPATIAAGRAMEVERLADHIARTVSAAPALTSGQRDRLALLLKGGDAP